MTVTITALSLQDCLEHRKSLLSSSEGSATRVCTIDPFYAFVPRVIVSSVRGQSGLTEQSVFYLYQIRN